MITKKHLGKVWFLADDVILEVDKLKADISLCIHKEYLEDYIDRFKVLTDKLTYNKKKVEK